MRRISIQMASLALILVACTSRVPGSSAVRKAYIEASLETEIEGLVSIESFEKVNGIQRQDGTYVAECRYVVAFKKSMKEIQAQLDTETARFGETAAREGGFAGAAGILSTLFIGMTGAALPVLYGDFEAGHRLMIEKSIPLEKADRGWRVVPPEQKPALSFEGFPALRLLASGLIAQE